VYKVCIGWNSKEATA